MALRDTTKVLFAETFKKMVIEMPFEKVRISDLCDRCGANRRSFYYHFRDKYDLAAWIYMHDDEKSMIEAGGVPNKEYAILMFRRLKNNIVFYRKVFSDKSQNSLSSYLFDYFVQKGMKEVRAYIGREHLSEEEIYAIKGYSYACIGQTVEWLQGKTSYSPEEIAALQISIMPEILKPTYELHD